jgi:cytochrome c oxidase subunit III
MTDTALGSAPLPIGGIERRGLGWWGMLCLIASEAALFTYLLFSYFYFDVQLDAAWLPRQPPPLTLALPNTLILLMSSIAAWTGERGVKRGARAQQLTGAASALMLGIVFVIVQGFEWHNRAASIRSSTYASLYYTVTGFHMAHVVVGLVILLMVLVWSGLGYFDRRRHAPVLIGNVYWHFVDAVWLAVFATFYLTPRLW